MDFAPYDRPLRVGILGLGRVYDLTITGYRDNDDAEIVALCDTDATKVAARGAEWHDATQHTDLDDFLTRDMDVVEVLTPTPSHAAIVERILDAGFHVNVQKPMARSLAEADVMLAAARRNERVLRVMENFLFYEPLQQLKQIVDTAAIGEPAGFHMKMIATGSGGWDVPWESYEWQFEQALAGTGILMFDDGWHKFSVARWLFGPVEEVMAWVGRTEIVPGMIVVDAPSTDVASHIRRAGHVGHHVRARHAHEEPLLLERRALRGGRAPRVGQSQPVHGARTARPLTRDVCRRRDRGTPRSRRRLGIVVPGSDTALPASHAHGRG